MHLEAAKKWGIFSTKATPLQSLSIANQISVVDISFLPDFSRALVVGILARKILEERTKYVRHIKAAELGKRQSQGSSSSVSIPVTWLMVDEAHILVPSKGKTAASEALVEYAKRGRMPGCALVLSTQQPYATDDRILSQVDILITHNLSFSDDISAFRARAPSFLSVELSDQGFIRRLPVGVAIIADQSTTTERAFVTHIRPRVSEHAGRIVPPETFKPKEVIVEETKPLIEEEPKQIIKQPISPPALPTAPTLFVPQQLATDYLLRLLQYRLSEYLVPLGERQLVRYSTITLPRAKREILGLLVGYLSEFSLQIDQIKEIEGTPFVVMQSENAKTIITSCLTESVTIIGYGVSAKKEQDLVKFVDLLRQIPVEFHGRGQTHNATI
jgi:hypothetical protein